MRTDESSFRALGTPCDRWAWLLVRCEVVVVVVFWCVWYYTSTAIIYLLTLREVKETTKKEKEKKMKNWDAVSDGRPS